jgi:hypothetical protein
MVEHHFVGLNGANLAHTDDAVDPAQLFEFLLADGCAAIPARHDRAVDDARVLLPFGECKGSVRRTGSFWVSSLFTKKRISRRVVNIIGRLGRYPSLQHGPRRYRHHAVPGFRGFRGFRGTSRFRFAR